VTAAEYHLLYLAEQAFTFGAVGFALWRGDATVRLAALCVLAPSLLALVLGRAPDQWIELPGLAGLCVLAVRAPRRPWLTTAAACYLALVASFAAAALDPHIRFLARASATNVWSLAAHAALIWGAVVDGSGRIRRGAASTAP
jgi:hypothetical protein